MSLGMIHEIFSSLPSCKEWNAHALKFNHSKSKERYIIAGKLNLNHLTELMHWFKKLVIHI